MGDNRNQNSKINNSEEELFNEKQNKIEIKLPEQTNPNKTAIRIDSMDNFFDSTKKRPNSNIFRGKKKISYTVNEKYFRKSKNFGIK